MSRQEPAGLADQAAEAIRQLNYDVAAPRWPSDVYSVLGALALLAGRLGHTLQQYARFLEEELSAGRLTAVAGLPFAGDAALAVADAARWLKQGQSAAGQLLAALDNAHQATAGLAGAAPVEDEDTTP